MGRGIGKGLVWRGRGFVWRTIAILFILLVPAPILLLLLFRYVPVPGTPEMLLSLIQGKGASYSWSDNISPRLERAVIGSEDENFCTHHGFDWKSINKAMEDHKRHPNKPERGASTISQQTARTLFLLPVRSWVRKGLEAYLTVMIEQLWPKKRILTAYLNLVDWGDGIFGAEAAARGLFWNRRVVPGCGRSRPAGRHPAQSAQMACRPSRPLCPPPHRQSGRTQRHGGA